MAYRCGEQRVHRRPARPARARVRAPMSARCRCRSSTPTDVARPLTRAGAAAGDHRRPAGRPRPGADAGPRDRGDLANGQLLLMPSETATAVGVKVAAVAPGNPARGLPAGAGVYLLLDRDTLALTALLDGAALTDPAHPGRLDGGAAAGSSTGCRPRPRRSSSARDRRATGHVAALRRVPRARARPGRVRRPRRRAGRGPSLPPRDGSVMRARGRRRRRSRAADVVVCATTARTPLFDAADVRTTRWCSRSASHEPDARELRRAAAGPGDGGRRGRRRRAARGR